MFDRNEFILNLRITSHRIQIGGEATRPLSDLNMETTRQVFQQHPLFRLGQVVEFRFEPFQQSCTHDFIPSNDSRLSLTRE